MRLIITTTDGYGNETGTRRAWLEDLIGDSDLEAIEELNFGPR